MKIKIKFLLLLLTLLSCCMASAQDVKKIAILETVDKEDNVKYGVELLVRTQMTKAIIEIDGYEAYDRISMSQIMGEHNFQRTGYVSEEQIKEIGIAAGADYVLIMEAAYVDDETILLSSKFINIETTEIELIDMEQTATDAQSVLNACRTLAKRMLKPSSSQSGYSSQSSSFGYSQTSQPQQSSSVREIEVNGVKFKMIKVVGGSFSMGATAEQTGYDKDEIPVHQVTLSDYYIAETEVTQELWYAVMGNNPSNFTHSSRNPVEKVSWHDCQTFIQKLNQLTGLRFRLPTEAEWEYAARGGNQSKGYKYSGSNRIDDVAWYKENSSATHEVAKCYPNELGIYDMSGNVWEWCSDSYGRYSVGTVFDPEGASSSSFRVFRGGSWDEGASRCRVANRDSAPGGRFRGGGFRLACSRL